MHQLEPDAACIGANAAREGLGATVSAHARRSTPMLRARSNAPR